MAGRIFDQTLFRGQGALMTLASIAAGHEAGGRAPGSSAPNVTSVDFGRKPLAVFLRWQLNPAIGLPSEPFKVWRRPAVPLGQETTISATTFALPPIGHVVQFSEPYFSVTAEVRADATPRTVLVVPLAGGIGLESMLGVHRFDLPANGQRTFTFQAPQITGLLLINTSAALGLRGLPLSKADAVGEWQLIETVGLPVDETDWADLAPQRHGIRQGLVGAEVDAATAAAQRYQRGVNPYGWRPHFPTGEQAPAWELPSAEQLIKDAEADVLPVLHEAMRKAPSEQAAFTRDYTIHPPENPGGDRLSADDGKAVVSPVALLQLVVSTDPLQAVALGFGTGYPYQDLPAVHFGDRALFNDPNVSDWDYMVTGLWARGLDGRSEPQEYAALIPRPRKVVPPPAPGDLALDFLAHHQPEAPDRPWRASVRLSWERLPLDNISSVASFVAARHDAAVAGPAAPLLERRPCGRGHMPIGNTTNPDDPERVRQSATDSGYPIPNDPGNVNARYGAATQNIFGVWSPWATHAFASTQPEPDLVQIADAELRPADTGSGTVCPAELTLEIVVDWRVRSVRQIDLRGRLFAAATRHQSPPAGFPSGLQKTLGGPAVAATMTFTGDVPALAGGSVMCLDPQGGAEVTPGAAQQSQSRRYRLTIPGFSLDYASTPHVGLALQARLKEVIAPGRTGAWTPVPRVAYASDPRSRPTEVLDIVQLASLPDASGQCHARIAWQAVPGAQGYILYESNETKMLSSRALPAAAPGTPLSTRLGALKAAFTSNPDRNDFTRVNRELLTGASLDVTLPRGSQVIHLYVVIPLSAGGAEGPWPSGPNADESLIAYVAPKIAEPAPPMLELARVESGGGFAAQLRIGTRGTAGARPKRIDVYRTRVADAARRLDSMGPAVATVTATTGPWTVAGEGTAPDDWIAQVRGTDAPSGSWNYVWYRAVAWSEDDPPRGVRRGRSRPSPASPVLIPPAGPPPLSPLVPSWPGGGEGDVLFDFSADAPVPPTPVGPHTLTVEVTVPGAAAPLLRDSVPLHEAAEAAPVSGSGAWRVPDGTGRNYRLLVRRADAAQAASVTVRLTDPLGRSSERNYRIEPGPILPLPELSPIESFSISGRGTFYTFTVVAPDGTFGGEPYRLRVTLTPATGVPGPVIPMPRPTPRPIPRPIPGPIPRPFEPRIPTPFRPRPGPVPDLGLPRPRSQFRREGDDLVYFSPLADVPTEPSSETYSIGRQRLGDKVSITVVAREPIRSIAVDVITPDGRTVSATARG
ncbi:MAG: hypothetical protein JXB36_21010 [Gammaproteobacteria bacterium]|nr:hypothetical protein [Gammaproteobacteria bacterium]